MAQSPEKNAGTSEVIRYDLGWNAINALLRSGRSLSGHERNCCFLNTRGAQFANVSAATGLDFADDGRVLALADWDHDGDVDFWVANRSGPQLRYLQNNLDAQAHSVAFWLEGRDSNRNAIGARISLRFRDEPNVQTHTIRAGDGYLSQSSSWVRFGLGDRQEIHEVHIRWPSGVEQTIRNVAADGWYQLIEGNDELTTWLPPKWHPLPPSEFAAPPVTDSARIVLLTPIPLPELRYVDSSGNRVSALKGVKNARLINLWASWCENCLTELGEWQQRHQSLEDAGVQVVAVNVDENNLSETSAARVMAKSLELPFDVAYGSSELVARLDVIQRSLLSRQRPLPVPSSFLIDADGNLRVVYKGSVGVETLRRDAQLINATADADAILQAALPIDGQWLVPPSGSSPLQIALKLVEGGYADQAHNYAQNVLGDGGNDSPFASADLWNLVGAIRLDNGRFQDAAAAFMESLKLQPHNRQANIELGVLLLRAGKGAAAELHFRTVLAATPDDPEQRYNLGVSLLQQDMLDPARRQFESVIDLREDPLAYWQLGHVCVRLKDARRAIESYQRALSLKPELIRSANNLAWLLATSPAELRDGERAVEVAEQVYSAASDPSAGQLDTLAAAFAAAGRFEEAVSTAQRALQLADAANDEKLKARIQSRLELYRQNKPYVDER